jgi:hypothetical protein
MADEPRTRASWIGAPEMFNLNFACAALVAAFGSSVYLVGSAMERRDFRDVDVRCMLDDAEFARMFADDHRPTLWNARLSLLNAALSAWLAARTGLPIDFQFQKTSEANAEFKGQRGALGLFFAETGGSNG